MRPGLPGRIHVTVNTCFHPLAGKSKVRLDGTRAIRFKSNIVSIPLRGRVKCDPNPTEDDCQQVLKVSIPLRGRVKCDSELHEITEIKIPGFHPLAGKSKVRRIIKRCAEI